MPSVVQKRPWANGRSLVIARTTTFSFPAASWLNLRTEVAQTEVSRLGEMLSTTFLPFRSESLRVARSDPTSAKSGAVVPAGGRSPYVLTGFPFSVILAISFSSNINIPKKNVGLYRKKFFS